MRCSVLIRTTPYRLRTGRMSSVSEVQACTGIVAGDKPVERLLAPVRIVAVNLPMERLLALVRIVAVNLPMERLVALVRLRGGKR